MKIRIAIAGAVIVLLGCSSATVANEQATSSLNQHGIIKNYKPALSVLDAAKELTVIEQQIQEELNIRMKQAALREAIARNQKAIGDNIKKLYKHVDRTRYVFSGSTPGGWDCSGLVVWFYKELGITLPHSATKQGLLKPKVKAPMPGDVVVFKYKKSKNFIHSGIYVGNNKIIHAGFRSGDRTEVISLDHAAFKNQDIYFIRIIEN